MEVASLPYVDPARFDMASADSGALNALAVAIAPENVSLLAKTDELDDYGIEDKVLPVTEGASLRKMLMDEGADPDAAAAIQSALVANFSFDFRAGQKVRVGPRARSRRPARSGRCASASTSRTTATSRPSRSPTTASTSRRRSRRRTASSSWRSRSSRSQPGALPDAARRPLGHRPDARHDARRDQEPRPHLLLRRGLPDAALGERQPGGDLFDRQRGRQRRRQRRNPPRSSTPR